jgi:hypothetical protein
MDIEEKIAELADLTRAWKPNRRDLEPKMIKLLDELLDQELSREQLIQVTGYGEVAARLGIFI